MEASSKPTFKLTATGIQPGHDPQVLRENLKELFKGPSKEIEALLHRLSLKEPVMIAQNLPKDKAEALLAKLADYGLIARIEPMQLTLVAMAEEEHSGIASEGYTCPACGHKQPLARDQLDTCERCGVVGKNYEQYKEYKEALELERRYLKDKQAKERAEKAQEAQERVGKKKERFQQEMLERARRQAEKELDIRPWHKYQAMFKPKILLPILGSMAAAAIGLTFLVTQMREHQPDPLKSERDPTTIQVTITPPPGVTVSVDPATGKTATASGASASTQSAVSSSSTNATAKPDAAQATVNTAQSGAKPTATPALIAADKIAQAKPANTAPVAPTPPLLAQLAAYQAETGDEIGAEISLDRAAELLAPNQSQSRQPTNLMEALTRQRIEMLAAIAYQNHQRRDANAAQSKWYRAINLVNTLTMPAERARAYASIGRTIQDDSANTYFDRAISNIQGVKDPAEKATVLSAIARDLAKGGRAGQSADLFTQAQTTAEAIKNGTARLIALGVIAKARAESGDNPAAANLLSQLIGQPNNPGNALPAEFEALRLDAQSAMARNLVLNGNIPSAQAEFTAVLNQIAQVKDTANRASALLYLATQLAAAGDLDSAKQVAADLLQPHTASATPAKN